jgi:hypothetical protein
MQFVHWWINLKELDVCMMKTDVRAQVTARESAEPVRKVFKEDQKWPVRNASGRLNMPTIAARRILRSTLKKRPYHTQMPHGLHEDYPREAAMCAELFDLDQNDSLMNQILFSGEATFHICDKTNRHNCCVWAEFTEWERDSCKWMCGMASQNQKLMSLIFCRGDSHRDSLREYASAVSRTPASSEWYSRHCGQSVEWGTMSLCQNCLGSQRRSFSESVDWECRT